VSLVDSLGSWGDRRGLGPTRRSDKVEGADLTHQAGVKADFEHTRSQATDALFREMNGQPDVPRVPSGVAPGKWLGVVSKAATVADGLSGAMSVIVQFHRDRERCDSSYLGTIKEVGFSGAQILSGVISGNSAMAVAGGLAYGMGAATASAGIMAVSAGVLVGLGVSYVVGKGFDWARERWGSP
jgi:hypothetical protein